MSIPNRHRSPKSVRGRFPSTGVWLQIDTIEKILELTLADREHGRAFVRWPRDPERPPIKSLVKNAEPPSIEEQNLERRPTLAEEHEHRPAARAAAKLLGDHTREPLEPPSEVNRSSPTNTSTPCGIIGCLPCPPAPARWTASRDQRQPRPEPGRGHRASR